VSTGFFVLLGIAVVILAVGAVRTYQIAQKQRTYEKDNGLNATTQKHRIAANPVLIAYVLFPVAIVIIGLIVLYVTRVR